MVLSLYMRAEHIKHASRNTKMTRSWTASLDQGTPLADFVLLCAASQLDCPRRRDVFGRNGVRSNQSISIDKKIQK